MPNKDQAIGALIFLVCVVAAIGYATTLLFPQYMLGGLEPRTVQLWIVAIPVLVAFLALLSIGAWIGWTMVTTPSDACKHDARTWEETDPSNDPSKS